MIKKMTPLSMAESLPYMKDSEVKNFVKKFNPLSEKKAKELKEKLQGLNMIKLNDKGISKLIDVLPENKEEVLRAVPDSNLDENETNQILSTIKEFK
jgi:DNA-directed RNA polymerase subunit F